MATTEHAVSMDQPRSRTYGGIWSWVFTVDHKRIGILYGATAIVFFLVGGIEALLVRTQLAVPNNTVVGADTYNQLFTMHATTMVFLALMPLGVAFFNIVVPLQIGARDVAFPRLNAFSYWVFLSGGLVLNASWIFGGAPNAGWFGYANLTERPFNPGHGIDFWVIGLQILGVASMAGAFNFVVTIVNMRAPGMSFMRMPLFTWMTLVTSVLLFLAFPILTVGLIELMFDRFFATNFFNTAAGADPILWQHFFWLFGHPEVYILILPAMGMISDVLPTFSRKPLFGYPVVAYSGVAIGFMAFGVWAHHMFSAGLGPVADAVFSMTTMLIAVPTGIKIFNWIGTLHGGSLNMKTPLYFALGFIALFIVGGLTGVMLASPPADWVENDTYFVVAHIHYVLFGGTMFGLFAGIYYWFPKITGRLLNEPLGKWHFWLMFIGMNVTFGVQHILGIDGMPRRIYTYPEGMGWDFWNLVSTIGAFIIALSVAIFVYNVFASLRSGEVAGNDPWDGRTLEWSIPSPPPHYNFAEIPIVRARDPFWVQKHGDASHGVPVPVAGGAPGHDDAGYGAQPADHHHLNIHMPDPSIFPVFAALGFALALAGLMVGDPPFVGPAHAMPSIVTIVGLLTMIWGIFGWAMEPVSGY
jgi:cytochrome c oxidase subunit I